MKILWRIFIFLLILASLLQAQQDLETKLQKNISANFSYTPITDVLRMLASQNNINLVVGEGVSGKVTLQLTNVPLKDALTSILKSQGFHYVVQNDIIFVKPFDKKVNGELTSEVIKLNYVDGLLLKTSLEPLLSEKGKLEVLVSEPAKEEFNRRADLLVVNDVWENVANIKAVAKELDVEPVLFQIEVKLIETLVGGNKQVGISWPTSASAKITGGEVTAPITKSSGSQGQSPRYLSGWYSLPEVNDKVNLGVLTVDELNATLELLAQESNSRLVSNPKITATNNKRSLIEIGTSVPVPEVSRGISGDLVSYKEKNVSMYMEVIPKIGTDNRITLDVNPRLEEIIGYAGDSEFPQPIISRREVKTFVTVNSGETIAIGGLLKEADQKVVDKLWLLGDIPLLGYFFRHTTTKKEKTDLLIFITPKILTANSSGDGK